VHEDERTRLKRKPWDSKYWQNYITELYDQPNQPENLEVKPEEEVDAD
jgi:hypothetical protein